MEASKRRLKSVFVTTESDQLTRAYSARKAEERKRSSKNARIAAPEYEYCDAIADLCPKVDKGTTALAFAVKEGVMVAIDHYSSGRANASKEYAGNIINLDTHILVAVSGDVPDPRSFLRDLKTKYLGHNPAGKRSTVKEASYWLADTLCSHSEKGFKVDLLVAGWDKANGSSLYQVNGEGILFQPKFFAIRSGSRIAESRFYRKSDYEEIFCMFPGEAEKFARKLISSTTCEVVCKVHMRLCGETGG